MVAADYRITVAAVTIISMVTKSVFASRGCPGGWVPYDDSCYLGLDGSMNGNWSTAVMQCDRNNASIMVPSSDWENEFIFTQFQHSGGPIKGVFINCNDAEVEGEWNCNEDGIPTEYRKWDQDQPDDEKWEMDQDCGFMITRDYKNNPDILGYWGDSPPSENMFIVCERPRKARCGPTTNE